MTNGMKVLGTLITEDVATGERFSQQCVDLEDAKRYASEMSEEYRYLGGGRPNGTANAKLLADLEFFAEAIRLCHVVFMRYKDGKGQTTVRKFNANSIEFYDGAWVVNGYCHLRDGMRRFRLDRIIAKVMSNVQFVRPEKDANVAHYKNLVKEVHASDIVLRAKVQELEKQLRNAQFSVGVYVRQLGQEIDENRKIRHALDKIWGVLHSLEDRETITKSNNG